MDAERRGGEMSDAALDRDLRYVLAVDPPPEFAARLRARIASESDRSPWRGSTWTFAAGAVAIAAIVLVAIVAPRVAPRGDRADTPRIASRPLVSGGRAAEDPRVPKPASGLDASTSPERTAVSQKTAAPAVRPAPVRAAAPREPEVLVDPREAAALRAFFEHARRGNVDLTAIVAPAAAQPTDLNLLHEIYIAPIAFESVIATDEKGVRQ